ncbi:Glucose-responsive transcription factor [Ceratocystis pirilliformis]|uniref:Glucose-responsive transcription factor n=1 Tax=Ceratocystis pirilliformis TaxID=259994 RepID=A0ABR3YIL3_9PEZI
MSLKPNNWPPHLTYIPAPKYSPQLSKDQAKALAVCPDGLIKVPDEICRLPSTLAKIVLISDAKHPANGQAGLFATKNLKPGAPILLYLGVVHPPDTAHETSDYDLWLDHDLEIAVDAATIGNEARFINDYRGIKHRPNAEFREVWSSRETRPQGASGSSTAAQPPPIVLGQADPNPDYGNAVVAGVEVGITSQSHSRSSAQTQIPPSIAPEAPMHHAGHILPDISSRSPHLAGQLQPQLPQPPAPTVFPAHRHPHTIANLQLAAQLGSGLTTESVMQQVSAGHALSTHAHASGDPSLRSILPQNETSTERHYAIDESQIATDGQHLSGLPTNVTQDLQYGQDMEHLGRKRPKASRACDECRRKKIKCDAQLDTGTIPCTNCRRGKALCLFSRVPQKRGPNKGYIRELADRISGIEDKLVMERSLKRPCTDIAGEDDTPSTAGKENGWPESRSPISLSNNQRPPPLYANQGLAPVPSSLAGQPTPAQPATASPETQVSRSCSTIDGLACNNPGTALGVSALNINQQVMDGYLVTIHGLLPFLPDTLSGLEIHLLQCPIMLREAFTNALFAAVHSFPTFDHIPAGDLVQANLKLVMWQLSDTSTQAGIKTVLSTSTLVYLQTLLLLAVQADNRPVGEHGVDKTEILGRAVSTALSAKIYMFHPAEGQPDDTNKAMRIRVWWCLVIMDRWHAIGFGTQSLIREEHTMASNVLQDILPANLYHLARLNPLLNLACTIITYMTDMLASGAKPHPAEIALSSTLIPWAERFREDLPPGFTPATHPTLFLVYWHARLLAHLLDLRVTAGTLVWPCRELVAIIISPMHAEHNALLTALTRHTIVLTSLVLRLLARSGSTPVAEEATRLVLDLTTSTGWAADMVRVTVDAGDAAAAEAPDCREQRGKEESREAVSSSVAGSGLASASLPLKIMADITDTSDKNGANWSETLPQESKVATPHVTYENLAFDPRPLLQAGYLAFARNERANNSNEYPWQ